MKNYRGGYDAITSSTFSDLDGKPRPSVMFSPVISVGVMATGLWALIFAVVALVLR